MVIRGLSLIFGVRPAFCVNSNNVIYKFWAVKLLITCLINPHTENFTSIVYPNTERYIYSPFDDMTLLEVYTK